MKKIIVVISIICLTFTVSKSQTIPFGKSEEKLTMYYSSTNTEVWTIGYYKPTNYNSNTSDMIIYFHGQGGDQNEGYTFLKSIADKRGALLVCPTDGGPWAIAITSYFDFETLTNIDVYLPTLIKDLYKRILIKENRLEIPVRMVGFSAGGQCVTRYMLLRQGVADSLPIKMAISMNPYSYTFPTDTLQGIKIIYPFGIGKNEVTPMGACSESHIKSYYTENYTVLIGAADTANLGDTKPVYLAQGDDRYERAKNFYTFCQKDAQKKGVILEWYYAEVPNVGHLGSQLAIAKYNPTDTVTILEKFLFDLPYRDTKRFPPTANFNYSINDTTKCVEFSAKCECSWELVPTTYTWDFGNNIKQTGIQALYEFSKNGTYPVTLYVENEYGKDTITKDIVVSTLPEINITPTNTTLIIPNTQASLTTESKNFFSLAWYLNDTYFSNVSDFSYSFPNIGTYNVKAVVYNENGCVDTAFATIKTTESVGVSSIDDNSIIIQQKENTVTITSNNSPISKVQWFNIQGKEITLPLETGNTTEISYTTKGIKGIYTIVIFSKNERRTYKIHLN